MDVPTSSVSKLIDLLPLIIISVIVLVGFFTWEIFTKHLETFILLITSVLFAIWLYSGDIYSYLDWKKSNETGNDQFFPSPSEKLELSSMMLGGIISAVIVILGIGLTLGITSYKIGNALGTATQHDNIIGYLGYSFIGVGGITLLSLLWKAFRGEASSDASNTSTFGSTTFKITSSLFLSITGIYLIAKFTEVGEKMGLDSVIKNQVNSSSNEENKLSISNTVLNVGLVLQVVSLLVTVYLMYRYKWFHPDPKENTNQVIAILGRFGPFVFTLAAGLIFIAVQQKWFDSNEGIESGDDTNNMYAAHGIVYLVLSGITLLIALGKMSTFNIFKILGWISSLGFVGVLIWNFVSLNNQPEFNLEKTDANNGNNYYNQVKDEVTKEMKKSGNLEDREEAKINAKIDERITSLNTSNNNPIRIVNNFLLSFSLLITIIIGLLYAAKMKIVECSRLPAKIKNIFVGNCDSDLDFKESNVLIKEYFKGDPANIEKMNGDDWAKVLNTYDDANSANNFSKIAVHLAKLSRWIPFLTIILVITCISILFSKVTTSEATLDWIAMSFRGEMFSKVKGLLDTFFIVFIVGLLLCAILLLPMVREQNVGGLGVITKFVDSIQVWQYDEKHPPLPSAKNWICAIFVGLVVLAAGLSPLWYTIDKKYDTNDWAKNWALYIVFVCILALCCVPAGFHVPGGTPHKDFVNDHFIVRGLRLLFTSVYLVPLLLLSVFKLVLYFIPFFIGGLFEKPEWGNSFRTEKSKWDFTKWKAAANNDTERGTDLRLFGLGKILIPTDVISGNAKAVPAVLAGPAAGVATTTAGAATAAANPTTTEETPTESVDQTKVNAVGKLIKVIFIVILFVILILIVIYTFYKIGSSDKHSGYDTDGTNVAFIDKMNSPTAQMIYIIIAIIGIAGLVAYLREKFKATNSKTPEDYLFNDFKPEDSNSPMRQLTFGMTHIIYIVLMIVVWVYDTEKDDKNLMSVTGMTVLGILILFFHYVLEFVDNKLPAELNATPDNKPRLAPMTNLLSNIRFIVNTVFLIVISILAYYKQHSLMIGLIVIMFIFHLTKSILGVKLLKFIWACIIYIPCLLLDLIQGLQGSVGDTTRTIWIIVAIELLLIAILYGGPYLLNYIGASASQIVAAPISIKQKYDTKLNTQSKEIFIFHNTGIDRTKEDKAADCPVEEKKRYHYAISGWFLLNNNVTTNSTDLEIFNFGNVPRMTYNVSKNELKIYCDIMSTTPNGVSKSNVPIYNSRQNYNAIVAAGTAAGTTAAEKEEKSANIQMTLENEELDADIPLQRWNYFVINYDGTNMDFFLNNKLIFKSNFIMPDIQLKSITIGDTTDNKGLSGNICNFAFHKYPLTKEQIRWTYTMLKSQNPPMIGGISTVEDEVKITGKTKIYSQ